MGKNINVDGATVRIEGTYERDLDSAYNIDIRVRNINGASIGTYYCEASGNRVVVRFSVEVKNKVYYLEEIV